jgi:hypothetical protein
MKTYDLAWLWWFGLLLGGCLGIQLGHPTWFGWPLVGLNLAWFVTCAIDYAKHPREVK